MESRGVASLKSFVPLPASTIASCSDAPLCARTRRGSGTLSSSRHTSDDWLGRHSTVAVRSSVVPGSSSPSAPISATEQNIWTACGHADATSGESCAPSMASSSFPSSGSCARTKPLENLDERTMSSCASHTLAGLTAALAASATAISALTSCTAFAVLTSTALSRCFALPFFLCSSWMMVAAASCSAFSLLLSAALRLASCSSS